MFFVSSIIVYNGEWIKFVPHWHQYQAKILKRMLDYVTLTYQLLNTFIEMTA